MPPASVRLPPAAPPAQPVPPPESVPLEAADAVDPAEAGEPEEEIPVPEYPPSADPVNLPALAKVESWLGLSSLPDYEFLYRLTPANTGTGGRHWVMDVRRQDAQMKGPVHVKRLLQAGHAHRARRTSASSSCSPSTRAGTTRASSCPTRTSCEMLELLRQRRVIYRGTRWSFSDVPARPQIHLESRPDGATARIELLFPDGVGLPLKDVIAAGGPAHLRHPGADRCYPVEPDFPPRLLRKWLLEPTMSFPAGQLDRVLTFFAAHLPRFRMALKADGLDVDEDVEPHFVLTLEGTPDKVKVQLAARYGQTTVPVSPTATHLGYASGVGSESGASSTAAARSSERAAGQAAHEQGLRYDGAVPRLRGERRRGDRVLGARPQPRCPRRGSASACRPPRCACARSCARASAWA